MAADKEEAPSTNLYSPAIDRMRESLRQLLVFFGAIGAIIAAGIQFSNIGSLDSDSNRLYWAIGATAVTFAGVGVVLWALVRINNSREVTLSQIISAKGTKDKQDIETNNKYLLDGYPDVTTLKMTYEVLITSRYNFREQYRQSQDDAEKALIIDQITDLNNRIGSLNGVIESLLQYVSYRRAYRAYNRWTKIAVGGAVLVGVSISILAWATNPPKADESAPTTLTPSGSVALIANAQSLDQIAQDHGAACVGALDDTSRVVRVFVREFSGDDDAQAQVTTLPLPGCPAFDLSIDSKYLLPAAVTEKPEAKETDGKGTPEAK